MVLPLGLLLGLGQLLIRKTGYLPDTTPALAYDDRAIFPRIAWFFQTWPKSVSPMMQGEVVILLI